MREARIVEKEYITCFLSYAESRGVYVCTCVSACTFRKKEKYYLQGRSKGPAREKRKDVGR